jgi:phosphinothricin acetyltransferase
MIRPVRVEDAAAIRSIYNHYIENTVITFEEKPVDAAEMERRIKAIGVRYPWLVLEEEGNLLGYAYVNSYRERSAYRYTAELSIYLRDGMQGRGRGSALLEGILEAVKTLELHVLISALTLPNERSVALHEKFGFGKIAVFREVGFKHGRWLDVGYWELLLSGNGPVPGVR